MNLINDLIENRVLKSSRIIKAFQKIKRKDFVLSENKNAAEIDAPLSIGHEQTISQPTTVAFMLELLQPESGDKILDVGSGSGWTVALLAEIVGEQGAVYGIERIKELKQSAESNVVKYNFIKKEIARIFCADGYKGLPKFAPFDKIIAAAAAESVPNNLLKQLKINGRLVMPIGKQHESQDIIVIDKIGKNNFKEFRYHGFIFVPLVKN
ncbi:protein-L-isoaspartate O-methyltransferase [Candidatus Parcubacteria bacterium]|nr:protein-L-isoaspartate O-methyltransferase [Candidatus Parcubacteria bacterium]